MVDLCYDLVFPYKKIELFNQENGISGLEIVYTTINLPNIMYVAIKNARDIKEVCSANMDV